MKEDNNLGYSNENSDLNNSNLHNSPNNHNDTKKVVDTAAKGAAEAFAPGVGGKVYDAAKNIPGVGSALDNATNQVAEKADKIPGVKELSKGLNQSGTTDMANKAIGQNKAVSSNQAPNFRKNSMFNNIANGNNANNNAANNSTNENQENSLNNSKSSLNPLESMTQNNSLSGNDSDIMSGMVKKVVNKYRLQLMIGGGGLAFFIFIIMTAVGGGADYNPRLGLYGFPYYELKKNCETVKVYNPVTDTYTRELDFETEYVPGVMAAEVGEFTDSYELLKAFAIQIRDYALYEINYAPHDTGCVLEGSSGFQNFTFDEEQLATVTNENNVIAQAAAETFGLIGVKGDRIARGDYDMACYRSQDDNYYYVEYGGETIGEKKLQPIPKTWNYRYLENLANNNRCSGHGDGASQVGAYYLTKEEDYSYLDVLKYYNGNELEIQSIYKNAGTASETSTGSNDIINVPLRDFLNSKGTSVEALNEYILSNVLQVGIGTREAAVQVAVSLINGLYTYYQARIPYTLCGQRGSCDTMLNSQNQRVNHSAKSFYGVDPYWGSRIHGTQTSSDDGTCVGTPNPDEWSYCYRTERNKPKKWLNYAYYGPECAGFITWILHNAGFIAPVGGAQYFKDLTGSNEPLKADRAVGVPGDLLVKESGGHVTMIVGVDNERKVYLVAEASGGSSGTKISSKKFDEAEYTVVDMTSWYNDSSHKLDLTNEEFIEKYRNGYIDGYTGRANNFARNGHLNSEEE